MNAAFAEGNTAAAEKWGLEMLHDGDMTSVRLVAEYMVDCGYSPKLREAALKKAAELEIQLEGAPSEGAPWRLHSGLFTLEQLLIQLSDEIAETLYLEQNESFFNCSIRPGNRKQISGLELVYDIVGI